MVSPLDFRPLVDAFGLTAIMFASASVLFTIPAGFVALGLYAFTRLRQGPRNGGGGDDSSW